MERRGVFKRVAVRCLILCLVFAGAVYAQDTENKKVYRALIDLDGVQRIEVTGGGYFFNPDHIIVKKGIPVELIVSKESGIVPHNIVIKYPEAGIDISESMSTKQKAIRFTPTKAGEYHFYCDKRLLFFKSHRDKGMEGVIEVE